MFSSCALLGIHPKPRQKVIKHFNAVSYLPIYDVHCFQVSAFVYRSFFHLRKTRSIYVKFQSASERRMRAAFYTSDGDDESDFIFFQRDHLVLMRPSEWSGISGHESAK
jgi:hypothetical protein